MKKKLLSITLLLSLMLSISITALNRNGVASNKEDASNSVVILACNLPPRPTGN